MESLLENNIIVHIYCISECRLTDIMYKTHFENFHPLYNSLYFPSRDHNNGGLLFLIHKSLSFQTCPDINLLQGENTSHSTDIQWIKINFSTSNKGEFLVGSVYINPQTTSLRNIQPIFNSIVRAYESELPFVIGGDFNAYHPSWNNVHNEKIKNVQNKIGKYLFNAQLELNLTLLNTYYYNQSEPTRPNSNTVLDLIFTSDISFCDNFEILNSFSFSTSDHLPVMCTIKSSQQQEFNPTETSKKQWRCNEATVQDWKNYQFHLDFMLQKNSILESLNDKINECEELKWMESIINTNHYQNMVDELWNTFHTTIMDTAYDTIGIKIIKPRHKFWFVNSHIQNLLKIKRQRRDNFLRNRRLLEGKILNYINSDEYDRINLKMELDQFESKVKELKQSMQLSVKDFYNAICTLRNKNWIDLINKLHNPEEKNRVQWKILRMTMGIKHSNISHIKNTNGIRPKNIHESLNNMAKYFSSISTHHPIPSSELVSLISFMLSFEFRSVLQSQPTHPFFGSTDEHSVYNNDPILKDDVIKYCIHIPTDTALGWDFLSPHFLKNGTELLFQCFHKFFYLIFKLGKLPLDWLRSNICALHKNGDKELPENYRPISLTPIIMRLYERLLLPKVWGILDSNKIISPFQAGFRKNHGTLDNLYWFIQRINNKFMHRQSHRIKPFLPVVFLDLKKAFDKINISITLRKLHQCGIRGNLLHFFFAFLTNRKIRVINFDDTSDWFTIDTGTPQGSVLGPILFSIYINDLITKLIQLNNGILPFAYADDLCLVPTQLSEPLETTLSHLQDSLDICSTWAKENFMTFSKDKSNLLCFRNIRQLDPYTTEKLKCLKLSAYDMETFPVKVVETYKYLGIIFNSYVPKLFEYHWEDLMKSVQLRVNLVSRAIKAKSTPIMVGIQLVISIIRSKIGYSLSLISTTKKEIYSKLESLLIRPLKIILGLPRSAPNLAVLAECGISSIDIWKDKLTFQLAHRIAGLPQDHLSYQQFYNGDYSENHLPVKSSRSYKILIESLGSKIRKLEMNPQWEIKDHRNLNIQNLKSKELQNSYHKWITSNTSITLRGLKPLALQNHKREYYIVHDAPHISRFRALFRLNRFRNNELLFKYRQSPHPRCPFCDFPDESNFHILMDCPEYSNERKILNDRIRTLLHHSMPITMNILLGDYRSIPYINKNSLLNILTWTGHFIEYIVERRKRILR
jgi:hypothetical protein